MDPADAGIARSRRSPGTPRGSGDLPAPAFLLIAFAPVVAATLRVMAPQELGQTVLLVWLLGLVPVFLLSRYLAWRGTLFAIGWTTFLVILAEFVRGVVATLPVDWTWVGVVVVVLASVGLGAGLEQQWWRAQPGGPGATGSDAMGKGTDGLPTRDVLEYFLAKVFAAARRRPPLSVVLLEIDRFAEYEELYGRAAMSAAVESIAASLRRHTRAMNVFGRYDTTTLLILLQGEGLTGSHAFARRILEETAATPAPWKGRLTLSAGIAGFEPGIEHPDTLLQHAGQALAGARRMGGNCAVIYRGHQDEALVTSGMMVMELDGRIRELHRSV